MDASQIIVTAAEILALKELTPRVLGPTADVFGEKLKSLTENGFKNIERVFRKAEICGRKHYDPSTGVPSRVVKAVLEESYVCDDELEASYLGGVLASAKGPISRDDRALSYLSILASLSSYQIRTHCILYSSIVNSDQFIDPNIQRYLRSCGEMGLGITVCLSNEDYMRAMEFSEKEDAELISQHAFVGLQMKGLCEGGVRVIGKERGAARDFRYFHPTAFGIELFVWGMGRGHRGFAGLFDTDLPKSPIDSNVKPTRIEFGQVNF